MATMKQIAVLPIFYSSPFDDKKSFFSGKKKQHPMAKKCLPIIQREE